MNRKLILITVGDPNGIGPEVVLKSIQKVDYKHCVLITSINVLKYYSQKYEYDIEFNQLNAKDDIENNFVENRLNVFNINYPMEITPGEESMEGGELALKSIEQSVELVKSGTSNVLLTGPVSKSAIKIHRDDFIGHTDYLAEQFGTKNYNMMLMSDKMRVVLVTTHLPISSVSDAITEEKVKTAIRNAYQFLKFIDDEREIAVCGLNPHAGESGTIGFEDEEIIAPAIDECNRMGINVSGPYPADSLFPNVYENRFGLYIAMYHDQGLVPLKLLSFGKSVNMTLGLPFHRVSVDHGTAFDIAGKGIARSSSFLEALKWSFKLAEIKNSYS